jgi:hypothetical protein
MIAVAAVLVAGLGFVLVLTVLRTPHKPARPAAGARSRPGSGPDPRGPARTIRTERL